MWSSQQFREMFYEDFLSVAEAAIQDPTTVLPASKMGKPVAFPRGQGPKPITHDMTKPEIHQTFLVFESCLGNVAGTDEFSASHVIAGDDTIPNVLTRMLTTRLMEIISLHEMEYVAIIVVFLQQQEMICN